jgi:HK97 family phage major capsid protein
MDMTTANGAVILTPAQVAELLVQPVSTESVAMQVASVVNTGSSVYRIPLVTADPQASWVAEGAEIAPSDAVLSEVEVAPSKVAGLTIITRELAEDSSPEAAQTVGAGLARDIARKVDAAFFGSLASPAPAGLGSLLTTAGNVQTVAGGAVTNLDAFAEAQSKAENVGASLTAFVANPTNALALAKLKSGTGSNQPLLGSDPTQPTRRLIGGVPLYVSADVPAGTIWGIPQDRAVVVIRDDATVETDTSVFFTSDRVAIKATMRVGFGFPHLAGLVKITVT